MLIVLIVHIEYFSSGKKKEGMWACYCELVKAARGYKILKL